MELLRRQEDIPAAYPDAPSGLSTAAQALDSDMIWARIESWIAWRWTPRQVKWTVKGPGAWAPDLHPTTISTSEKFISQAGEAVTLDAEWNDGLYLDGDLIYRLTGEAGGQSPADLPAEVVEAYRRLAEYLAEPIERHGAGRYDVTIGPVSESFDRTPKWVAQALSLSGAADLLRNYRRAP